MAEASTSKTGSASAAVPPASETLAQEMLGQQQFGQFLRANPNLGPQGSWYSINPPVIASPHVIVPFKQEEHDRLVRLLQETALLQAETARMRAAAEHMQAQIELNRVKSELKKSQR
jgi:hypothetical protein